MVLAIAILVVAILAAVGFGRWLKRKGEGMERGDE